MFNLDLGCFNKLPCEPGGWAVGAEWGRKVPTPAGPQGVESSLGVKSKYCSAGTLK